MFFTASTFKLQRGVGLGFGWLVEFVLEGALKFVTVFMQVYERSYEICRQLYEKELLTDTSYLYIYGFVACHS